MELKERIRQKAKAMGFDAVGFAAAARDPRDATNLAAFLADGRHGDMAWMATTAERRADPQAQWPEARSVIVVGVNYGPAEDPLEHTRHADRGAISVYAQGRDYHRVITSRLKALARWLGETIGCEARVYVDTAPVMEKPLAMRAGLGWIGKHTNLVSRRFGSWLFLGEVFVDVEIAPDTPATDLCGSCDRCVRACPTDALREPYRIEPRRCISYLTIEHKGDIDAALQPLMGNRVYGCDDCLAVCPWNKFAAPTPHDALAPRPELAAPPQVELAALDETAFRALFAGTAIKRTGRDRFVRNVMVAAANGGVEEARRLGMTDEAPLVRAATNSKPTDSHTKSKRAETSSAPVDGA